jgi:hypothetical protein
MQALDYTIMSANKHLVNKIYVDFFFIFLNFYHFFLKD